jgi:N6-L-threonylcarbamoyladenine synthase
MQIKNPNNIFRRFIFNDNSVMCNKFNKNIIILGIESSCDDTSIAVSKNNDILSNIVADQKVHKKYGGVVPELASREHQKNIIPTLALALKEAQVKINEIDGIAFTRGPGLMGSLLVGASFAKSLSIALSKPLIEINHMEAHVLANFIDHHPNFPFICLTVSGGHTQLVLVKDVQTIQLLGETLDDSAGETFDKCAKLLGLNYPGGPEIEKEAISGDKTKFKFTTPKVDGLNFSFSGLKTNIRRVIENNLKTDENFISKYKKDLCASIQYTIIHILMEKLKIAIETYNIKNIAISGGVAANEKFRSQIKLLETQQNCKVLIPKKEYSTDNGAMIAIAGYYKYQSQQFTKLSTDVKPRYRLNTYIK